jgi:hypothetical protein
MIRKIVVGVVLAVALSAAAGNAYAITPEIMAFGTDVAPGLFCEVEKLDVCVMAQTEEDCTKLGGEKVDSCSMAENEKE